MDSEKIFYAKNRKEWRNWLSKNHKKEKKIALLKYKKHTGKPSLSHKESMEEAICFGWIDTTIKKLDDERYIRRFTRRTDKSRWSNNTLSYAKSLIKEGKMGPEGLKRYKEGLKKPVIDHGLGKNPDVPKELLKELNKKNNIELKEKFEKLPPSSRRSFIIWVIRAKQSSTKEKRVLRIIENLKKGKKTII